MTKNTEEAQTTTIAATQQSANNNNLLSRAKKYIQHIKQCITLPNKQSECKTSERSLYMSIQSNVDIPLQNKIVEMFEILTVS